jgi:hypothetical protein
MLKLNDKYKLDLIDSSSHFKLYFLYKEETIFNSVYISFSKGYIILFGDLTPTLHGNVSTLGYGEKWFAEACDWDYLCSKFLTRGWHPDHAIKQLKEHIGYIEEDYLKNEEDFYPEEINKIKEEKKVIEELVYVLETNIVNEYEIYQQLEEIDYDLEGFGIGYDPTEVDILCAIQSKFSELYHQNLALETRSIPLE